MTTEQAGSSGEGLKVGDEVEIIGFPCGMDTFSITMPKVERLKSLMQQVRREIHEQGHVSSGSWASMLHVEGLLNSEGRAGT